MLANDCNRFLSDPMMLSNLLLGDLAESSKIHSEQSTGIPLQTTSVGILKNNQERENKAGAIIGETLLPEAMLICCVNITLESQPACPFLLVCEIPADKSRSAIPSKVLQTNNNKGKSKSVSYSTQLSFESEDEYYDPLFSVPGVFHSMNSPLKDASFSKTEEKCDETRVIKDAKIVQCFRLDIEADNVEVNQIIPYEDGNHILLVLNARKEKSNVSKAQENTKASSGPCSDSKDMASSHGVRTDSDINFIATTEKPSDIDNNTTSFDLKENGDISESYAAFNNSCNSIIPKSEVLNEEAIIIDHNSKNPVVSRVDIYHTSNSSDYIADKVTCSEDKDNPTTTNEFDTLGCAAAHLVSNADSISFTKNVAGDESNGTDNMKCIGSNPESMLLPDKAIKFQDITSSTSPVLNSEHSVDGLTESSKQLHGSFIKSDYSAYLLLYKTRKEKGRTLLEDKPCKTLSTSSQKGIRDVFLLPDDVEDSFMSNSVEVNDEKKVYLAGTFDCFMNR